MANEVSYEQASMFADGALGAAGHQVTDPVLLDLSRRMYEGEISSEAAMELARERVLEIGSELHS